MGFIIPLILCIVILIYVQSVMKDTKKLFDVCEKHLQESKEVQENAETIINKCEDLIDSKKE